MVTLFSSQIRFWQKLNEEQLLLLWHSSAHPRLKKIWNLVFGLNFLLQSTWQCVVHGRSKNALQVEGLCTILKFVINTCNISSLVFTLIFFSASNEEISYKCTSHSGVTHWEFLLLEPLMFSKSQKWIYIKQGGSVMCVCTLSSDPAQLNFTLNCLPKEEEIKKINISTYRSTKEFKKSTLEGLWDLETYSYHNMSAGKEGYKNQIVANINYDQNSLSLFWKPL